MSSFFWAFLCLASWLRTCLLVPLNTGLSGEKTNVDPGDVTDCPFFGAKQ